MAGVIDGGIQRPGRSAASAVAPIVYLGATDDAGFAIVVGPHGTLTWTLLPDAGRRALDGHLVAYRRFLADPAWRRTACGEAALAAVLGWAWDAIMSPVVDHVAGDATVTLVPLGGLGLLPLHAAGRDRRLVDDLLTVTYAPSARMAVQARRDAEHATRRPPMLLGVSASGAGASSLPLADAETRTICEAVRSYRLSGEHASRAATLAAMGRATIWHFARHGQAEPLASRLLLAADDEIRVADIFAQVPGSHRLAMLSACETAAPDAVRPDEMIGFPAALKQAGVAGECVGPARPVFHFDAAAEADADRSLPEMVRLGGCSSLPSGTHLTWDAAIGCWRRAR